MKTRGIIILLAFSFGFQTAVATWGNSSTYPYSAQYRKTTVFSVKKLDSAGASYSLPYIQAYSLTGTGVSAFPAKAYFRLITDPHDGDPAYDAYLHKYDFFGYDSTTYNDYGHSYSCRSAGNELCDPAYYNQFGVSKTATLDVVGDKLKIDDKYFCLYDTYSTTTGDYPTGGFGFSVGTNLSDLSGTDWPGYKLWTEFSTVPDQPYTFLRHPFIVRHVSTASASDACPDSYGTPWGNTYLKILPFDDPLPDAEDDDAFNKCISSAFYTGWEKSASDWGSLSIASSNSGTTSIGIWEGFLNLFRTTQTNPNTYTDLIFSGGSDRYDQIAIERVDFQNVGDPYGGTSPTTVRGKESQISLRSVSSGTLNEMAGIEIRTNGLYATGSYGKAYFYDSSDSLLFVSPVWPKELDGNPYLVGYFPASASKKSTKIIWKGFDSIQFLSVRPVKGTTSVNKSYCQSNAFKCSWRSYDGGRTAHFCADTSEWLIDPFGSTVTYSCTTSTAGTCKPVIFTGSFLGAEGVKLSYVIGGQGAYYVDASGSLKYDPERRKIGGYIAESESFGCDTEGLSWYQVPGKYFDCVWNKGTKSANESINLPTKIANGSNDAIGKNGSGSSSFKSFFRTTPGEGEGTGTVAVQWVNSKSFSDMNSGLGRFFVTAFIIVIAMVVLGLLAMLIFSNRK